MLTITIPPNLSTTHIIGPDGQSYLAEAHDGRIVIKIPPAVFMVLLKGPDGLDWSNANQDPAVRERMQPGFHVN